MFDRNAGRARAQGSLGVRVTLSSFDHPGPGFAAIALVCGLLAAGLSSCQRQQANAGAADRAAARPAAAPSLLLAPEDLVTLHSSAFAAGPPITGSIQPERAADLRAEVSAVVVAVLKENGDPVRRGDLLVRLDDTAIRDTLTAADAALRAALLALEQAERQFQRMSKLREDGVVSAPQLEEAEARRNSAQSEAAAARTRVVTARQQLARTEVRAPFDGVVNDRKVNGGDTAQIGKELLKVIDPRSLRFQGFVSAEYVGALSQGQRVSFRIHGLGDTDYAGIVTRVNPAASAATRQVEVLVSFADPARQPRVSGLYAEGRLETQQRAALTLPAAAVVRDGDRAFAWRVRGGKLARVALEAGDRDARTGEVVVHRGLDEGDAVVRYPAATLQEGQAVQIADEATPPVAAAARTGAAPHDARR
jgi:RND family efflux transporter MFP subunit